jgi:hypothetical protein
MTDTSTEQFSWAENESVAVREQPSIAVYQNNHGQVVLRRERSWDEEDDCFIPVAKENVLTIVRAILVAAEMDDLYLYQSTGALCHDVEWPGVRPAIAARMEDRPDIDWNEANATFDEGEHRPKDPTAAERQRRHRANKRNSNVTPSSVTDTVTDRDAPRLELVG